VDQRVETGAPVEPHERAAAQLVDGFPHHIGRHLRRAGGECQEERVVAQDVHAAGYTPRMAQDQTKCGRAEQLERASGLRQPMRDVAAALAFVERRQVDANRDQIGDGTEPWQPELLVELGLAEQDDREAFELPQALERVVVEALRLVHDQHGGLPLRCTLRQEGAERTQQIVPLPRLARRAEVGQGQAQQSFEGKARVGDVRGAHVGPEAGEEGIRQRRLARADFADHDDEPAPGFETMAQSGERLAVVATQEEPGRVRGQREGIGGERRTQGAWRGHYAPHHSKLCLRQPYPDTASDALVAAPLGAMRTWYIIPVGGAL
jgi:hypothetical protein